MSDKDFDALKAQLRQANSRVTLEGPRCSLRRWVGHAGALQADGWPCNESRHLNPTLHHVPPCVMCTAMQPQDVQRRQRRLPQAHGHQHPRRAAGAGGSWGSGGWGVAAKQPQGHRAGMRRAVGPTVQCGVAPL